jgi:hypothetical protein
VAITFSLNVAVALKKVIIEHPSKPNKLLLLGFIWKLCLMIWACGYEKAKSSSYGYSERRLLKKCHVEEWEGYERIKLRWIFAK